MYIFADSLEVVEAFGPVPQEYSDIFVVEIELTDYRKSPRPNPAIGIEVAIDKASHSESPVVVVAAREYMELERWQMLISFKNVFVCLKPISSHHIETMLNRIFSVDPPICNSAGDRSQEQPE